MTYLDIPNYIVEHEKFIKESFSNYKLVSEGNFSDKMYLKILMEMSMLQNFEISTNWYDSIDTEYFERTNILKRDPTYENWIDIEGIGYGWMAISKNDKRNKKIIFNEIVNTLKEVKNYSDYKYLHYKLNKDNGEYINIYYFMDNTGIDTFDYQIRVSSSELFPFND